jgi:threonine dehydratase
VTNAIQQLSKKEMKKGIATASSGNHGAALSKAVCSRGGQVTVIMPDNSSPIKVENVRRNGGNIIWCKPRQESREQVLSDFVAKTGAVVIHPYNDERIIAGQGTAAKELLENQPDLDIIITPLSGGGLLSGTLCAVNKMKPNVKVFGAEPKEADDAYRSLKAGKRLQNETTNTICDGLRAQMGEINFLIIKELVDGIITLTEVEIIDAMHMIWERMKIIVEPSSSIVLAAVIKHMDMFEKKKIGLILSGGNVDLDDLPW